LEQVKPPAAELILITRHPHSTPSININRRTEGPEVRDENISLFVKADFASPFARKRRVRQMLPEASASAIWRCAGPAGMPIVRCGQAFAFHHLIDAVELDDVVQSMQRRGHVCAEEGSSAKCAHGLNRRAVEPEFHPIYPLICQ
jgi:hypothetical protein